MNKFLGTLPFKDLLKKTLGGREKLCIMKTDIYSLIQILPVLTRFSPFWGNFFKDLLIWLITVLQVCILGWVSNKYSYLLKTCSKYIFQFSILSISTKAMGGNYNLWTSVKNITFSSKLEKQFWFQVIYTQNISYFFRVFLGYLSLKLF